MGVVLARDVHVTENGRDFVVLRAGQSLPKKFAKLVTNPKAFADEVEEETSETVSVDPASVPYDKHKVEELRELLKSHELPTEGKKEELVARLVQFDEENADESEEDEGGTSESDANDPNEE